jgi:hypothetical protein
MKQQKPAEKLAFAVSAMNHCKTTPLSAQD